MADVEIAESRSTDGAVIGARATDEDELAKMGYKQELK